MSLIVDRRVSRAPVEQPAGTAGFKRLGSETEGLLPSDNDDQHKPALSRSAEPSTAALVMILAGALILSVFVFSLFRATAPSQNQTPDRRPHPRLCDGGDGLLRRCDDDF